MEIFCLESWRLKASLKELDVFEKDHFNNLFHLNNKGLTWELVLKLCVKEISYLRI